MAVYVDPYIASITAKLAGVRGELRIERDQIVQRAKSDLASHRDEGDSKVSGSRGTIDFFANLDDDGGGALAIEADLHIMRRAART